MMVSFPNRMIAVVAIVMVSVTEMSITRRIFDDDDIVDTKILVDKLSLREPRSVEASLFSTTLFESMRGKVNFDLNKKIGRCCSFYQDVCKYPKKFNVTKEKIIRTASEVDQQWNKGQQLLIYLQASSSRNVKIARHLKSIFEQYVNISETTKTSNISSKFEIAIKSTRSQPIEGFIANAIRSTSVVDIVKAKRMEAIIVGDNIFHAVERANNAWILALESLPCEKLQDGLQDAYGFMELQAKIIKELHKKVHEQHKNMTDEYDVMKMQITSLELLPYLEQLTQLSDIPIKESKLLQTTSEKLQKLKNETQSTESMKYVYKIQGDFIKVLEKITLILDCYNKRALSFQIIYGRCKRGMGSLKEIYDRFIEEIANDKSCFNQKSIEHTEFVDIQRYVNAKSKLENYHPDCISNRKARVELVQSVCSNACSAKRDELIATELKISIEDVRSMKSECDATCQLTLNHIKQICQDKAFGQPLSSTQIIYSILHPNQVQLVYDNCNDIFVI